MKRIFTLMLTIFMLLVGSMGFAEEYPAENYEMYYKGVRSYPIVFAQWGYGYVLDMYSVRRFKDDADEIVADIHEVEMATNRMKANPLHIYAKFNPDHGGFVIGFQDNPLTKPKELQTFDYGYLDKGTSETGLLFPAGRALWEMYTGTPLYKKYPMLKPVGEPGAPCMISVNENTRYARLGYDKAQVQMEKASGLEDYFITFKPEHFVIDAVYAENEQIEERLRREEVGQIMYYHNNPRVRLVANYMGFVPKLVQ